MSKSRLEKFLYALHSLDSSDLPNPLSRIEELYKCLVTGEEAPIFEPLSRVEKYLMAILGVYNVDSLPNPISRVEVLLYKLATGDDNLDDVKSFLSEHEELLAEIIRNGGVGGNIDIEYVLYILSTEFNTLYNTAEKPVKSAILKGNSLMNMFAKTAADVSNPPYLTVRGNISQLKSQTTYTVKYFNLPEGKVKQLRIVERDINFNDKLHVIPIDGCGTFTIQTDLSIFKSLILQVIETEKGSVSIEEMDEVKIVILEGDHTKIDIPFFEGMQSVKMPVLTTTGKNLINNSKNQVKDINSSSGNESPSNACVITDYIPYQYGTNNMVSLYVNGVKTNMITWRAYDKDKNYQGTSANSNTAYIRLRYFKGSDVRSDEVLFQLEENSVVTPYEPYKSNILTTPEDVTLRGIGTTFNDELNLLTGELTKRVGEIVLDGSENWSTSSFNTSNTECIIFLTTISDKTSNWRHSCDRFKAGVGDVAQVENVEGICSGGGPTALFINVSKTKANTVEDFKNWLSNNNVTLLYQSVESVKTVDISVANQDGNNTKLSTFDDLTHVSLSSEGLIPEAELEVATKNEEVLNTMSLEMDYISATQTTLEETSDTQSENADATMIATTEIYEELL